MKLTQRILSALLALLLVTGMVPVLRAEAVEPRVTLEVPAEAAQHPIEMQPRGSGTDSETLLEGYLEQAFYGRVSLLGTASRDTLDFAQQQIYDAMKRWFEDVAAGRQASSDVIIHLTLSASQLGISSVYTEIEGMQVSSQELIDRLDRLDDSRRNIFDAVSADSPFDTYWIDSGRSWWYTANKVEEIYPEAQLVKFCCRFQFPVSAHYADPDSLTEQGYFRTDLEKTGRNGKAAAAGENARSLVAQNQGLGDLEKLEAYKHYICTQVTYDDQAVLDNPNDINGSGPWELINVFDRDPTTNVVCAGYGKAFQYLCDLSDFQADITCYQATGEMVNSGLHLWNIVEVDGVQLLVDVTCVDQDQIGVEEDACFLATVVPKAGGYAVYRNGATWIYYKDEHFSPARTRDLVSGLSFTMQVPTPGTEALPELRTQGGRALVTWTPALKNGKFASNTAYEAQLTLIPTVAPFLEDMTVRVNGNQVTVYDSDAGLQKTCRISFPATGTLEGWVQEGDGMKYRDAEGNELRNTWADIDGSRYHFDDQGFVETGFLTENGKTYYLDHSGRMTTGWQTIGGYRYYFGEDGVMATNTWVDDVYVGPNGAADPDKIRNGFRDEPGGTRYYDQNGEPVKEQWLELEGELYRFDALGYLLRSCWFEEDGYNYYLDADGRAVRGWQTLYGNRYYFDEDARQVIGWRDIDGHRYFFSSQEGSYGRPVTGWQELGDRTYYFGADGIMRTGWQEIEGSQYYFGTDGVMVKDAWVDGHYLKPDGSMDPDKLPPRPPVNFLDVPKSAYYYDAVSWAVSSGITAGTSANLFSPEAPCIRKQVVTFLWRAMGQPEPQSMENPFVDVGSSPYQKAILWAYHAGITAGVSANRFGADEPCSRKQIVTFLWRAAGQPEPSGMQNPFRDVLPDYFRKPILWAVGSGITAGTSEDTFSPNATCTRAQIVSFLYRWSQI